MRPAAVFKVLLLVVVVAFVALTAWDLGQQWQRAPPVRLALGWLLASVAALIGVSLFQVIGWRALLVRLSGRSLPRVASLELLLAAMLGRYAPAKAGMPAILVSRAQQLALAPATMASSMVLAALAYGVLGLGLGGAAMLLSGGQALLSSVPLRTELAAVVLFGMALVVLVLLVVDRRRFAAAFLRLCGVEGEGPLVGVRLVAWTALVWASWWVHGVLLVVAVGGTVDQGLQTAWLFVLAPVLGFLAVVTPGGLGVREAVVAMGLTPVLGAGPAVSAALVSRATSLGMDVVMWLGFRAALRRQGGLTRTPPAPRSAARSEDDDPDLS